MKALQNVGEWVIWEILAICNTFSDNRQLLILSRWVISYGSENSLIESSPKFEKISLTSILLKIFDIYFFCYLATNEKIAITHLWHAMGPQTMYHVIAKDKVAEQHIWRKTCYCNSFGVMSPLLKVAKIAITHLSLGLSQ